MLHQWEPAWFVGVKNGEDEQVMNSQATSFRRVIQSRNTTLRAISLTYLAITYVSRRRELVVGQRLEH